MEQQRGQIGQQIELPFAESLRISFQSLKIRFGRSIITTAGITLGIAFMVSVLTNSDFSNAMKESGTQEQIATFEEEEEQGQVSIKEIWLIIMSLIVCVVGIANAMLMAVTERFREIGTMKCLGALDRFVVRLFLLEAGFQGLAGALLGALIGTLGSVLLNLKNYGLDLFFYFPLLPKRLEDGTLIFGVFAIVLFGALLGMILAILGAAFPAWRAAKLPPAEAMRSDV